MLCPVIKSAFDIFIEVSLVHTKSGVGNICLANIFHSFIWVSDHEIVCTEKVQSKIWIQMNVVLILVSQRYFVYQRNLYCLYSQEYGLHELGQTLCSIYIRTWIILFHWNTKLYVIGLIKIFLTRLVGRMTFMVGFKWGHYVLYLLSVVSWLVLEIE